MNIQKGNKLKASKAARNLVERFMDYMEDYLPETITWNDVMPVVEKIESIYDTKHGYFGVHIYSNACTIQASKFRSETQDFNQAYLSDINEDTKIQSTWKAAIQFLQWYNQNKSKQ